MNTRQTGLSVETRIGLHIDDLQLDSSNRAFFKQVGPPNHTIDRNSYIPVCESEVEYHRLTVRSALTRKVPNFLDVQITIFIDELLSDILLKCHSHILTNASC